MRAQERAEGRGFKSLLAEFERQLVSLVRRGARAYRPGPRPSTLEARLRRLHLSAERAPAESATAAKHEADGPEPGNGR